MKFLLMALLMLCLGGTVTAAEKHIPLLGFTETPLYISCQGESNYYALQGLKPVTMRGGFILLAYDKSEKTLKEADVVKVYPFIEQETVEGELKNELFVESNDGAMTMIIKAKSSAHYTSPRQALMTKNGEARDLDCQPNSHSYPDLLK